MSDHILIIEDEKDLLSTLEYNFKYAGYKVSCSSLGLDGVQKATSKNTPDLIILDLMLPDMSGLEVCKEIRNNPISSDIKILMLTAKGEEVDRVLGLELGADDYVVKPFSMRELILRVSAKLDVIVTVPAFESVAVRSASLLIVRLVALGVARV